MPRIISKYVCAAAERRNGDLINMKNQNPKKGAALLSAIGLSALCGALAGLLIFAFKILSNRVIALSGRIFSASREDIRYLPLLVAGAFAVGLVASAFLKKEPSSRGGGIPTAVALVRGLFDFKWLRSILTIFPSAMLTYLGGVPLGNEGPSVQMGTAVGRGTVSLFGKRYRALDRYLMTGGACAGFAAATGAPLSGIIFAIEEAHRKYSPMLFLTSSVSVAASTLVSCIASRLTGTAATLFSFDLVLSAPLDGIWYAAVPGIVCGAFAIVFTKLYRFVANVQSSECIARVPLGVKCGIVFALCAFAGYFTSDVTGSGHGLVEAVLEDPSPWYILLAVLALRVILLILTNNVGVTGGLFLPTLAVGALIGSLVAKVFIGISLLPAEYYSRAVVLGMIAYMSAASRTPVMAISFAAECLLDPSSLLSAVIASVVAFLTVELSGESAFSDTVIEKKLSAERHGKKCEIVDALFEVKRGSFAQCREPRDLLLPPSCVILSVRHPEGESFSTRLGEHDVIHLRYQTYDSDYTEQRLCELFGEQSGVRERAFCGSERHLMPEDI